MNKYIVFSLTHLILLLLLFSLVSTTMDAYNLCVSACNSFLYIHDNIYESFSQADVGARFGLSVEIELLFWNTSNTATVLEFSTPRIRTPGWYDEFDAKVKQQSSLVLGQIKHVELTVKPSSAGFYNGELQVYSGRNLKKRCKYVASDCTGASMSIQLVNDEMGIKQKLYPRILE